MPDTGLVFPSSASNVNAGDTAWTSPTNALTDNATYSVTSEALEGVTTDYLYLSGFGLATSGNIVGIEVQINYILLGAGIPPAILECLMTKDGTTQVGVSKQNGLPPESGDVTEILGTSSDLWSASWTPSEINASTFGVFIALTGGQVSSSLDVDYARVRVTYATVVTDEPSVLRVQRSVARW